MADTLFYILIFPGFFFLSSLSFITEYIDRKLVARFQNRVGPPFIQPLADFVKLVAKEDVVPEDSSPAIFKFMPLLALAATLTAFLYIPLWTATGLWSFQGDVIVLLYLLTIPTLTFFLAGWYSTSLYAKIGAVRTITQLFAYEVPLFMAVLACAILADSWTTRDIASFYSSRPWLILVNLPAMFVGMIALLGKLEKVPFDIPEAETEIVAGTFTEYSGRLLALFRLTINIETIVAASLLAAVMIPFGLSLPWWFGVPLYLAKVIAIVCALALLRAVFARFRIDQMMQFCWKVLAPIAFFQIVLNLILKGFVLK
jgi:NADH-quinone oxidoreductase subunit H